MYQKLLPSIFNKVGQCCKGGNFIIVVIKMHEILRGYVYSPIYIGYGPKVFENSLGEHVPDLSPHPGGFINGRR